MENTNEGIVITGANGQIGRKLLRHLAKRGHTSVRALVRSEQARRALESLALEPAQDIRIVDYTSPAAIAEALEGMHCAVHLVGIIKESVGARYVEAHEQTCHALALAANRAGLQRIIYLSILGSAPQSKNACLASKGRAETLLLDDRVATTVLRVPMVLGGDDLASASLRRQAQSASLFLVGGGRSLQQPMDIRDVLRAICAAQFTQPGRDLVFDLGGPECLAHRELVLKTAKLWNKQPRIRSLPLALARTGIRLLGCIQRQPPITLPMFEILQHDDRVDPARFSQELDIKLTPLSETLADFAGPAYAGTND